MWANHSDSLLTNRAGRSDTLWLPRLLIKEYSFLSAIALSLSPSNPSSLSTSFSVLTFELKSHHLVRKSKKLGEVHVQRKWVLLPRANTNLALIWAKSLKVKTPIQVKPSDNCIPSWPVTIISWQTVRQNHRAKPFPNTWNFERYYYCFKILTFRKICYPALENNAIGNHVIKVWRILKDPLYEITFKLTTRGKEWIRQRGGKSIPKSCTYTKKNPLDKW